MFTHIHASLLRHECFESKLFSLQRMDIGGTKESIVVGGRHLYADVAKAFKACGVNKVLTMCDDSRQFDEHMLK